MARKEPQFDVQRVTWMRMSYPSNRALKDVIVKREAQAFEDKVRRDLECLIYSLR